MRFTIVIPTFNRAEMLRDAVRSALQQSHADKEIIVIDDGSTDRTEGVVSEAGAAVRYLRQENQGKAAALNLGISASQGDAIIILDDDDVFPPCTLAKHAAALAANPCAAFSYGRYLRFQGQAPPAKSLLLEGASIPQSDPRRLIVKLMENSFIPNPCWAVRRTAQLSVGPYDVALARSQDYDMSLRLARANDGTFIDDIVLYQRRHEGYRGPLHDQTLAVDTTDKWIKYDRMIFQRLDEEWDLRDFQPFGASLDDTFDRALAHLQKAVVLFRRKVYQAAQRSLENYRSLLVERRPGPAELKIATGLLGSPHGIDDLLVPNELDSDVSRLFEMDWPLSIRVAFGSQLRWRIRKAIEARDIVTAARILRLSRRAFGLDATVALGVRPADSFGDWEDAGRDRLTTNQPYRKVDLSVPANLGTGPGS
jgi:glycosyltransferase involved in cell wall biosynthesis